MASRTRQTTSAAVEVEEGESSAMHRLQFNEPLSWRAGKPIAIGELLRRLGALAKELRDMEQDDCDRDSLTKVAKDLAGHGLLAHKDKGVRAWTACCLVDILRLCAPDAPYTATQLKDIFTLIITSILPSLSDPSNAYHSQHTYVLQSLAQVKSIVLLTDIPSSEQLIMQLFASFFDIISGSSKSSTGELIGKSIEYHMTAILVILVDEASHLPLEIIDVILAQFLRADPQALTGGGQAKDKRNGGAPVADEKQSTLLLKELPPAYNMAKTICTSCPEKMARYVSQYFNDVIIDASASVADGAAVTHRKASNAKDHSDDEDAHVGPTEEDLKELRKAHRLLRELWRAAPLVLQNVVPQLEAELSAENVQLRLLATETLGDMVSGIGSAGPPPPPTMDPTVYPPQKIDGNADTEPPTNPLTTPSSPLPFAQVHPAAYQSFLGRKHDKSALVRAAWATAVGRILSTSAGRRGLSRHEEEPLLRDLAVMLVDADERVRVAAVKTVGFFSLQDVVLKLGSMGGIEKEDSVFCNLAGRARDRKHAVRVEAITTLGRIWGTAAGEIAAGNDSVIAVLGSIPSKLFDTFYVNDLDINVLLDHVLFEQLLPLEYPPSKLKPAGGNAANSQQKNQDSQKRGANGNEAFDLDRIRAERTLYLVKSLDAKARKAFFAIQGRQVQLTGIVQAFLKKCEEYNGGVMENNEEEIKGHITKFVKYFASMFPDASKATSDLWRFVKTHDRRNYQLVRFSMDPNNDYRTVIKAIKELRKRILSHAGTASASMLETLMTLLYRTSLLVYNKSHIPTILQISRLDDHELSQTAHEVLKDVSTRHPEVFKAHVSELCRLLEEQSPSEKKSNDPGALDDLKACSSFARRYPKEMPHGHKFVKNVINYALYGTPPVAAKHAVSIIMAVSERKEMHAKDLIESCVKGFEYGSDRFLTKLAALSQLVLLAPREAEDEADAILDIAVKEVLLKVRTPSQGQEEPWVEEEDDECKAKISALRILVNRIRSHSNSATLREVAQPVYQMLNTLIAKGGELSKKQDTPAAHKARFRLAAAQLILKLCTSKEHEALLQPADFDRLALMAQDSLLPVRSAFMRKLKKYLGQGRLPPRFYAIVFLQAFEPEPALRDDTITWIRSRAKYLAQKKSTAMETSFARLLSLLAHHPDYGSSAEDLADFAKYLLFYLRTVASEDNLALIFYIAQRVKQTQDAVAPEHSERLYYLSDLAQAVIRRYEDQQGWAMQTWPGKVGLPSGLFRALPDHDVAQEIATKMYLPDEVSDKLDALVKAKARLKRKSDGHDGPLPKKRSKAAPTAAAAAAAAASAPANGASNGPKPAHERKTSDSRKRAAAKNRTPRKPKKGPSGGDEEAAGSPPPSEARRRSGRTGKVMNYAESSDSEDHEAAGDHDDEGDDDYGAGAGEGHGRAHATPGRKTPGRKPEQAKSAAAPAAAAAAAADAAGSSDAESDGGDGNDGKESGDGGGGGGHDGSPPADKPASRKGKNADAATTTTAATTKTAAATATKKLRTQPAVAVWTKRPKTAVATAAASAQPSAPKRANGRRRPTSSSSSLSSLSSPLSDAETTASSDKSPSAPPPSSSPKVASSSPARSRKRKSGDEDDDNNNDDDEAKGEGEGNESKKSSSPLSDVPASRPKRRKGNNNSSSNNNNKSKAKSKNDIDNKKKSKRTASSGSASGSESQWSDAPSD